MPKIDIAALKIDNTTNYPEPFRQAVAGRFRKRLGNAVGLSQFGVNLTTLKPGAWSSQRHWHRNEDEFIYVLEGEPTLVTEHEEVRLSPGMCAGFPAQGLAHQLVNRSARDVVYLEIGDRTPGDTGFYPADDIEARQDGTGAWAFTHKDGTPY